MTPAEQADAVLKTFDAGKVAAIAKKIGETWWLPGGERVPSKKDIQKRARQMLLELLLDDKTMTVAITSGGLVATLRGRLAIAYCPVRSEEFP